MHITYEFRKFMTNIDMNSSNNARTPLQAIDQRIKDLKAEEEEIIKVCTQLTQFLRANALNPVNDDILEYIQHFIREEQIKRSSGAQNDAVIDGLKKLLADYTHEMSILQKAMETTQATNPSDLTNAITYDEIFLLVGKLYRLPINGAKIREQIEQIKIVQQKFSRNREQTVNLPSEADSSSVMADLRLILT
jgi:hypothetical protein